jgi:Bacterial archaeo-eukaryotic release factor family 3
LQLVDGELAGSLNGAPLVLAGVAEEIAAYSSVSAYPRILEAKPGSPAHLSWAELGERAKEAVMMARRKQAETVLAQFRETARRDRVLSDIREILAAAHEGRVYRLLLEKEAEYHGLLGPVFPFEEARLEGEQDLLNTAAVQTTRGRGDVDMFDPQELGGSSPISAVLRYAD